MPDHLSEPDDMTLRTLAVIEGTTVAEQRRIALAAYAREARQDPDVAKIVALMLRSRRQQANGASNVIRMDGRAGRCRG
jgi:hypothetical protein